MFTLTDSANNDWGYKFTARAHCVIRQEPPPIPPLKFVAIADHIRLLGLRALRTVLRTVPSSAVLTSALCLAPTLLQAALSVASKIDTSAIPKPKVLESNHPYDYK